VTSDGPIRAKRIAPAAYQALREALSVIFWYKRPFEGYLRTALRGNPEILAHLNFRDVKRAVVDEVIDWLAQDEDGFKKPPWISWQISLP